MGSARDMSRGLKEDVEALERKAQRKAAVIRRVVREYNQTLDDARDDQAERVINTQREMERVVAEYLKLYKSIRRARKKAQPRAA